MRLCANDCGRKLAKSNPGPRCRVCQEQELLEKIEKQERQAAASERREGERVAYRPGPRQAVAEIPQPVRAAPVRTIRIDAIPKSAENRLESEVGELYGRLIALGTDEALVIPRENKTQIRNTCERLRTRLKNAKAGKLRWRRDGLTLYVWRETVHGGA